MSLVEDRADPQVITEAIDLRVVGPQDECTAIEADLVFDPSDPFAVTIVFRVGRQVVQWTFHRELLTEGLYEPVGDGDVRVRPYLGPAGSAAVVVELRSPHGHVRVRAHTRAIRSFVDKMLAVVPDGREDAHVDVDRELSRLLLGDRDSGRHGGPHKVD